MANLDTPAKRHSALLWGLPFRTLPLPDGTIGQGDRQAVAFMYSGVSAGAPSVVQLICGGVSNRASINGTFSNRASINGTFDLEQC